MSLPCLKYDGSSGSVLSRGRPHAPITVKTTRPATTAPCRLEKNERRDDASLPGEWRSRGTAAGSRNQGYTAYADAKAIAAPIEPEIPRRRIGVEATISRLMTPRNMQTP